ncbi:MAG: glycoside hydrolase family 3 protein, partial [Bdellovibrionales bacterium]|nr:glycoside hydrolase family 3 protein [Bdellovibrionales bacterium]
LAPVLDISQPDKKSFIGNRSFGDNPDKVKVTALAFAEGLTKSGILPTAKHFPGHGSVETDSHRQMPIKELDLQTLYQRDLVPFRRFVQQPTPSAIMVAHVAYPKIDPSGVPATFSPILINNVLRDRMGYNGIVITDDIEMSGANSIGNVGERALRALEAGCDMIMVAWSPSRQKQAYEAVLKGVKEGRITQDRLKDSLRRILRAKLALAQMPELKPTALQLESSMKNLVQNLKSVTEKVSVANFKKSSKAYINMRGFFPEKQPVLVFAADPMFYKAFQRVGIPNAQLVILSPKKQDPVAKAMEHSPNHLAIYYVTGDGTARRLRSLSSTIKQRLIVVNAMNPGLVGEAEDFKALFNLYSRDYRAGAWVAEFLFKPEQRFPSSVSNHH